jgi:mutator protein MutT
MVRYLLNSCYHKTMRIAVIIIRNSRGDFYVHQRKADKKTFPNLFGLGAGGKIEDGEEPLEGAKRELREETGLKTDVRPLFNFVYRSTETEYPIFVHETITDEELEIDDSEWQWSGWMKEFEVDGLLSENKLCPDTAEFYVQYMSQK